MRQARAGIERAWGRAVGLPLLALLVVASWGGCGLGDEHAPSIFEVDAGVLGSSNPSGPSGVLSAPLLDPVTQAVTCAEDVAITGRAVAGQTIVGTTPLGSWVTVSNAQTGRFCVAVGLAQGPNAISVYVNGDHGQSPPARQTITRQAGCAAQRGLALSDAVVLRTAGELGASSGSSVPVRVVKVVSEHAPAQMLAPKSGATEAMIDGDVATYARYDSETDWSGWGANALTDIPVQIHLALDRAYPLSSIVIVWKAARSSSGTTYASEYQVAVASGATPGELPTSPVSSSDPQGWQFVASKLTGSGGEELIDLSGAKLPTARAIVLRMVEDGDAVSWGETFEIAEIRVKAADSSTVSGPDLGIPAGLMPTAGGLCSQSGY